MTGAAAARAVLTLLATMALSSVVPPAARASEARLVASCAELVHGLQGRTAGALRAAGHPFGVRLAPDADDIPGPVRAAGERVVTPGGPVDVVTVSDGRGRTLQHLVLNEASGGRCRLVSVIDVPAPTAAESAAAAAPTATPPAAPPTHAVVRLAGGGAALVVQAPVRGGTGLLLVRERWYLLDTRGVRPLLDLPVRGLLEGWPSTFDRAFAAGVTPLVGAGGVVEVSVAITASFTTGSYIYWMPVEPLFTIRRTAYFTWRPGPGRFVLDAARSDIYEDEIEGLFEDAEEQFLRHHVSELIRLAASGTAGQRRWLQHFLDAVADSPERRAVMEALP